MNEYGLPDFQMDPLEVQSEQDISNAMYGPESTTNPTDPGVALRAPDPVMLPTPSFVQEVGTVTPSPDGVFGLPGNWLDNLASSLANVQMARPRSFGQGLLGGFAQGFSTSRMRGMSDREKLDAAQRDFAAKRNQANLDATKAWQETRRRWMEDKVKRRLDREDKAWELNYRSTLESPRETFTLTPEEARAMPGYTAGAVVPKDVKQEALLRTRPGKSEGGAGGKTGMGAYNYEEPQARLANTMVNDFSGSVDYQNWTKVRNSYENLSRARDAANGFGDVAMVYSLIHIIEPGSTVMQGERDTLVEAIGKMKQYGNFVRKFVKGDEFTPEGREAILRLGRDLARPKFSSFMERANATNTRLRTIGVDPIHFGMPDPNDKYDFSLPSDKPSGATVKVKWNGKVYTIPAENLTEAIARGAMEVK